MIKTDDPSILAARAALLDFPTIGFNPEDILRNGSFCLVLDDDLGLFEKTAEGVYSCHYFFVSRGRQAVSVAKKMVEEMFEKEGASVLQGLTPVTNLGALWVTRQLGSRFIGEIETELGIMAISMLTKKDYYK